VRCTCLACLEGVRIRVAQGQSRNWRGVDDGEMDWLMDRYGEMPERLERRAEMLAEQYTTRTEIVRRMPADWKPDAGWFEARGVKNG
jgi:hypothetical protein